MSHGQPEEQIFRNARIVLRDEVVTGSVRLHRGWIAEVCPGPIATGHHRAGEDLEGDFLIPGLVELHTDHIEGHFLPRPKVRWNMTAAVQAHDNQIAASGITTVFDALRVGEDENADFAPADVGGLARTISDCVAEGRLRADHFLHIRCEVSSPDVLEGFERIGDNPLIRLASLMDHAPGQRQFVDPTAYKTYYQRKMKLSDAEFAEFSRRRLAESEENADRNRIVLAARCHASGISVASHDDATADHVAEAVRLGISLAEFPTTVEAARLSHAAGLKVLMGAPNIVRGGSHSGNIGAAGLLAADVLDILSSDYVPFGLMQAAFQLADEGLADLPRAIRLVSTNPAEATGLTDRGEIAAGRRGDLVRVAAVPAKPPIVRCVWRAGNRVA
jgi:alpha-D-ribose 1-methylphosphonate 5-triphosphate diphosphatase